MFQALISSADQQYASAKAIADGKKSSEEHNSSLHHDEAQSNDGFSLIFDGRGIEEIRQEFLDHIESFRPRVTKLSFQKNSLRELPPLPDLSALFYLDVSHNNFSEFPLSICSLKSLEILDLSFNKISSIPSRLSNLKNLKVLSLTSNELTVLPTVLADLPSLTFVELDFDRFDVPNPKYYFDTEAEDFIDRLSSYIRENRDELDRRGQSSAMLRAREDANETYAKLQSSATIDEFSRLDDSEQRTPGAGDRARSSSEPAIYSKAVRRMGFVMQKNSNSSAVAQSLHSRVSSTHTIPEVDVFNEKDVHRGRHQASASVASANDSGHLRSASHTSQDSHTDVESNPSTHPIQLRGGVQSVPGSMPSQPTNSSDSFNTIEDNPPIHKHSFSEHDSPVSSPGTNSGQSATHLGASPPTDSNTQNGRNRLKTLPEESDDFDFGGLSPENPDYAIYRRTLDAVTAFYQVVKTLEETGSSEYHFAQLADNFSTNYYQAQLAFKSHATIPILRQQCSAAVESSQLIVQALLGKCHSVWSLEDKSASQCQAIKRLPIQLFACFSELCNAWYACEQASFKTLLYRGAVFAKTDEDLCTHLSSAVTVSRSVLALLSEKLSKFSLNTTQHAATATGISPSNTGILEGFDSTSQVQPPAQNQLLKTQVRELSLSCANGSEHTEKLATALSRSNLQEWHSLAERRGVWEYVNNYLRSMISMLGCIKACISDVPNLAEIGAEVSSLAKIIKDIPVLLDQSSFKWAAPGANVNQSNAAAATGTLSGLSALSKSRGQSLASIRTRSTTSVSHLR